MASIEKRTRNGQLRWYARCRDPAGAQLVKVFDRRVDADRFLTTVEAAKLTGSYVDAKRASIRFRAFAEEHWAAYSHNLDAAVADGLVASNAAKAVKAPTAPRRRDVHLTDEDVTAILGATPEHYRPLVIILIGLGLRISEACGLRVQDVDFLRRTVRIRQQRRPGGDMGRLKTGSSSRDIPADDTVLESLAEQIRQWPRSDGLVFSSTLARPLTKSIAGHVFDDIERAVGFTVSPHSLRHYFGAGLISRGLSVVAVARWLGHSSPEITNRVYA